MIIEEIIFLYRNIKISNGIYFMWKRKGGKKNVELNWWSCTKKIHFYFRFLFSKVSWWKIDSLIISLNRQVIYRPIERDICILSERNTTSKVSTSKKIAQQVCNNHSRDPYLTQWLLYLYISSLIPTAQSCWVRWINNRYLVTNKKNYFDLFHWLKLHLTR